MAKVTAGVNAYNRSAAAEDPVNLLATNGISIPCIKKVGMLMFSYPILTI